MPRTFTSTKQAIGYAIAVQQHAAGPASRRDSTPGPPPDPWLASSIFACFRRAGLDPHDRECPIVRGILDWATHADEADTGAGIGPALRRLTGALTLAGIVDPNRPTLEQVGWRAVKLGGRVRFVSTTHLDSIASLDLEGLRVAVAEGRVAPIEQQLVEPDPQLAERERAADLAGLVAMHRDGWLDEAGVDKALVRLWGCSPRTARRHRRAAGIIGRRGPKPGRDRATVSA